MRILDENGVQMRDTQVDHDAGYLIRETVFIAHHEAVEAVGEEGHWETVAEYENGGSDVEWIVDVPRVEAKDAWDEYEDILRYRLYTAKELALRQIAQLKQQLEQTDYITAKAVDLAVSAGNVTELLSAFSNIRTQYKDVFAQRAAWRRSINELENQ